MTQRPVIEPVSEPNGGRRETGIPDGRDRVAIVADELPLVRLGMISVLRAQGFEVAAETHSGRELVSVATIDRPDLVVVGLPADLDLTETVRRLARLRPVPEIIAMTATGQEHVVGYLLALGVSGLALRSGSVEDLAAVVSAVAKGDQCIVAALHGSLAGAVHPRPPEDAVAGLLSAREREVLSCLAQGQTNREIAAALSVTLATVKSHLVRVYAKLEATNRNECLGRAVELGLLR